MRMMVFFDLPTVTAEDRHNYTRFRKTLIRNGFIMLQESVYMRLLASPTQEKGVRDALRKERPPEGIVQILSITEKQYSRMEYLTGKASGDVVATDERVVIL